MHLAQGPEQLGLRTTHIGFPYSQVGVLQSRDSAGTIRLLKSISNWLAWTLAVCHGENTLTSSGSLRRWNLIVGKLIIDRSVENISLRHSSVGFDVKGCTPI